MDDLQTLFASLETLPSEAPAEPEVPAIVEPGKFQDAPAALRFMTGGKATITLRSLRTGTRFTYRVSTSEDGRMRFVSLLSGADNESSYCYIGHVRVGQEIFWHGHKSRVAKDAPSVRAFSFAWKAVNAGRIPAELEIWHEARCGRCNRKLTVPESVASGFGPECINHVH